jgi:AraC family transcriptional regulator
MRDQLKAQIARRDVTVEVRSYEWDEPETRLFEVPAYRVSQVLPRMRANQSIYWRLPNERAPRPVRQFSIMPAHSPILVEAAAGGMTSVTCVFPARRFEQMVEVDEWTNELTAAFLGMRVPLVETLLERLAREIMFPLRGTDAVIDAIVTLLTAELGHVARHGDSGAERGGKLAAWQLDRLRQLLADSISDRSINVAALAESCSISPRHLVRRFKETTGDTIHGYVRRVRNERAKEFLAKDEMRLKDIAAALGFMTPSHFAAEFRQQTGCSPSAYRARLRER